MKLSPPSTRISTPPPIKQPLQITDIPAVKKRITPVSSGNPITLGEDRLSRLELIRQKRARENLHSLDEIGNGKEQSSDTLHSPVVVAKVDNVSYTLVNTNTDKAKYLNPPAYANTVDSR